MSIKAFIRAPIIYARAWTATTYDPLRMSTEKRESTTHLITELTERQGWEISDSERYGFSDLFIDEVPRKSGVYRFYASDKLKYIGKTNNLRRRLTEHIKGKSNRCLAELIASGQASVEWRTCLMPGWIECYEMTEYYERHGRLPDCNQKRCGALWD